MALDVRWKQRFENYERAFGLLDDALADGSESLSLLEREGVVQRFEYTFELAWKTLKDYLEEGGLILATVTPRQVIKEAFAARLLEDGQVWIDMLDHRNLLSHTYDSEVFSKAVEVISDRYLAALESLRDSFAGRGGE